MIRKQTILCHKTLAEGERGCVIFCSIEIKIKFLIILVFDNRNMFSVDEVLPSKKQTNKNTPIIWYYLKDRSIITMENFQRPWLHALNNWWGCKPLIPPATSLPRHSLLHLNQAWWELTRAVEVRVALQNGEKLGLWNRGVASPFLKAMTNNFPT